METKKVIKEFLDIEFSEIQNYINHIDYSAIEKAKDLILAAELKIIGCM